LKINADEAERIGLNIVRKAAPDVFWMRVGGCTCLQRLAVKDGEKLFESDSVFLVIQST